MKTTLAIFTLMATMSFGSPIYAKNADSGSNIGGGNSSSEYLSWCRGQSSLLRDAKTTAALKLENSGSHIAANKILSDGILRALKNSDNKRELFLHKALVRGNMISTHLDTINEDGNLRKHEVAHHILSEYYDFMINEVSSSLEIGAHIPYLRSPQDSLEQSIAHFEAKFVQYASAQLDWIIVKLSNSRTNQFGRLLITPIGDTKSFFKTALVLVEGVSQDLKESLWNLRFSCAISDLDNLHERVRNYDQGNRELFSDEKQAFEHTIQELKRIANSIRKNESCL